MSLQDPMSTMLGDANAQRLKDFMRTKIKVIVVAIRVPPEVYVNSSEFFEFLTGLNIQHDVLLDPFSLSLPAVARIQRLFVVQQL